MPALRAVLFDLDGTLVRYRGVDFESSWGAIAAAAGVGQASRKLLQRYLPQRGAYAEWVREDAALLAGIPLSKVAAGVFPPPLAEGVRDAVARLRDRYVLGIVSSGVALVADRVCEELGLDFAIANVLTVENGRFTGGSELNVDLWGKANVVRHIARDNNWRLREVCYVGDHFNDVPVLRMVGLGIAVHVKDPAVAEASSIVASGFQEIPELVASFEHGAV